MTTTADTLLVVQRHWQALVAGDLDALTEDYADKAILITGATGISIGRAQIGELLSSFLMTVIPATNTRFRLDLTRAEGELGYIVWQAESETHHIPFGSDTFVIVNRQIVMQTSAGPIHIK